MEHNLPHPHQGVKGQLTPDGTQAYPRDSFVGVKMFLQPSSSTLHHYEKLFRDNGRTPEALGWTKDKQSIRYQALAHGIQGGGSILDYGCGLGDLGQWLLRKGSHWDGQYFGVDTCHDMIESNNNLRSGPNSRFYKINAADDITDTFNDIVCCGVFSYSGSDNKVRHLQHIRDTLQYLFTRCTRALHIDFLAGNCDSQDPDLFYMNAGVAAAIAEHIGHRWILDRDYMPYEFCLHIFKNEEIRRPRNIYKWNH